MSLIKDLARELAQRDVDGGFSPASSIEELKTVLAGELLRAYDGAFKEINAAEECPGGEAVETRVVCRGERAALALNLQQAADREIDAGESEFLRACARAITGPTERELDLDTLLHCGHMEKVLAFAEVAGSGQLGSVPESVQEIRSRRDR